MKVERFIREYASYKRMDIENNTLMQQVFKVEKTNKINKLLRLRQRGLISINETIISINRV